jgi:surfeit locus 1 family protein
MLMALLVLLGAAAMVRLGFWQLGRYHERRAANALIARRLGQPPLRLGDGPLDLDALEYRRVIVTGTWEFGGEIVLRNQSREGRPGLHVVTPLRLDGSAQAVLVDRGWIPYTRAAPDARRAFQSEPRATVEGIARRSQTRRGLLSPTDAPRVPGQRLDDWFRVDIEAIQRQVNTPLLPIWLVQQPDPSAPDLPWRDARLARDEGPHLGYAIQWWSFAAILLVGYTAFALRSP